MVVIFFPEASTVSIWQDLTGNPSISTVQAPQSPLLQPGFAPVKPRSSLKVCKRVLAFLTYTSFSMPLTVIFISCLVIGLFIIYYLLPVFSNISDKAFLKTDSRYAAEAY